MGDDGANLYIMWHASNRKLAFLAHSLSYCLLWQPPTPQSYTQPPLLRATLRALTTTADLVAEMLQEQVINTVLLQRLKSVVHLATASRDSCLEPFCKVAKCI